MLESKIDIGDPIIDDPIMKLIRKLNLEGQAREQKSDIDCPECKTNLPSRAPFFGWDNEKGTAVYYCTICEVEFY